MFGFKRYNYRSFSRNLLTKDAVTNKFGAAPQAGERAPDFEGRTLESEKIRLSDFAGKKNVVLTFGSATCPFTAASLPGMNELYGDYDSDDVQFYFVYVREAHPGEKLGPHQSHKDKIGAAKRFREEEEVEMPMIVDELNGRIHRKYGTLPNPSYLIDKSGRVAFRALWTRPSVIEEALEELLQRQQERDTEHAIVRGGEVTSMPLTLAMFHAHRVLARGGDRAIEDFRRELGFPGRLAHTASRVAEPITLHPGRAFVGTLLAGAAIAGGLLVGSKLRETRSGSLRHPYRFHTPRRRAGAEGEYAVGI